MKKTLLSVLAGVMVISSAVAVPSLDKQKEACEAEGDFIWVKTPEGNETCIPMDPCDPYTDFDVYKMYCVEGLEWPNKGSKLDVLINKYAEKVKKTSVAKIIYDLGRRKNHVGVKTTDGGYFSVDLLSQKTYERKEVSCGTAQMSAFKAYGYNASFSVDDNNFRKKHIFDEEKQIKATDALCKEINDFATSLMEPGEKPAEISPDDENCVLVCE